MQKFQSGGDTRIVREAADGDRAAYLLPTHAINQFDSDQLKCDAMERVAGQGDCDVPRGEGDEGATRYSPVGRPYTDRRTFAISIPEMQKAQPMGLG